MFLKPDCFQYDLARRQLHSFPTRRSSDLAASTRSTPASFVRNPVARSRAASRAQRDALEAVSWIDRNSTRLNSSHQIISYAVFCLKKKKRPSDTLSLHTFRILHSTRHRER